MAKHDLMPTFAKFLDPQLSFALLEFASTRGIYDPKDVTAAQIELLRGTNMVDYAIELYNDLHGTSQTSEELIARREAVLEKLPRLQEEAKPIMDIITKDENVAMLKADRASNNAYLQVFSHFPTLISTEPHCLI
jgi:translation initiation factor 3 subunit E